MCRLEQLCPKDGSKVQLFMNTEVNVFKFNSSLVAEPLFRCHLELEVRNSNYGFSIFIGRRTHSTHVKPVTIALIHGRRNFNDNTNP